MGGFGDFAQPFPLTRRRRFAAIDGPVAGADIFYVRDWCGGCRTLVRLCLIVKALLPVLQGASPFLLIWLIYMMTSVLTEFGV